MVVYATANAARAAGRATRGNGSNPALTRVHTATGHWLALHGCQLDDDPQGRIGVTLQAATPRQMLPAFMAWHRLTPRETEVVSHLLEGIPIKQVARRLDLSTLTVNDHLKAIYRKTDVHGRDELIAHLTMGTS
jgi:DNA-binding CsgD family transcriptional regulator